MGCPRSLASGYATSKIPSAVIWGKEIVHTFLSFHVDPCGITRHFFKTTRIELYRKFFSNSGILGVRIPYEPVIFWDSHGGS